MVSLKFVFLKNIVGGVLPSEVRHRIFPAYDNVLDVTIVPIGANGISKVAKISKLEVFHRAIPLYVTITTMHSCSSQYKVLSRMRQF